jgi:hypothetical protein
MIVRLRDLCLILLLFNIYLIAASVEKVMYFNFEDDDKKNKNLNRLSHVVRSQSTRNGSGMCILFIDSN